MSYKVALFGILSICFSIYASAQQLGQVGNKGKPGDDGRDGVRGEVSYVVIRNDIDLDALLLTKEHERFLLFVSRGDSLEYISTHVDRSVEGILVHETKRCPTLASGKEDRDFLICYAIKNEYQEIISGLRNREFSDFPNSDTCISLFEKQKVANLRICE
jgi:hypothetical protein